MLLSQKRKIFVEPAERALLFQTEKVLVYSFCTARVANCDTDESWFRFFDGESSKGR